MAQVEDETPDISKKHRVNGERDHVGRGVGVQVTSSTHDATPTRAEEAERQENEGGSGPRGETDEGRSNPVEMGHTKGCGRRPKKNSAE